MDQCLHQWNSPSPFLSNMNSFRSILLPLLSFTALLLHPAVGIAPLSAMCSTSNNYTADDPFSNSLNQLMFLLATRSPPVGFGIGSVGQGGNRANGLALCRGDITSSACTSCIRTADAQIRELCPFKKQAIIWFDHCQLRYSDAEFFGEIDDANKFYIWKTQNATNPSEFSQKVDELMNRLMKKAYLTPLLFATGKIEIGASEKMYGLVQCSRDLSGGDCKKCLETAIGELPSCCDGKRGGRVVGGSCNVRYELYPFFDA